MEQVFFDKLQYTGEYNEMSDKLIVTNVFTDVTVTHHYANKYTAKRGFERIVRMMMDNEAKALALRGNVEG